MASTARERRGWSRARVISDKHLDLAMDLDGHLAQLRREAYPWDPAREQVRLACVATLVAAQAPQRRWQRYLDADIARAEGFGAPRSA